MAGSWIALVVTLWLVVLLLVVLVLGLGQRVRRLSDLVAAGQRTISLSDLPAGPPTGSVFPPIGGKTGNGNGPAYETNPDTGRIVLFMDSGCGPCRKLGESLSARDDESRLPGFELVLVTDETGPATFAGIRADHVVIQHEGELTASLKIPGTPFCVVVDRTGIVRSSGFCNSLANVVTLVQQAADEGIPRPEATIAIS